MVYGHTDSTGSATHNYGLSERRARSVANYLSLQGINDSRLISQGYGRDQPVANNDTAEGRAQNRRVELQISAATG